MLLGWAITAVILFSRVSPGKGWTQEELDLFDLVEEVGGSFYDLMQIDQVLQLVRSPRRGPHSISLVNTVQPLYSESEQCTIHQVCVYVGEGGRGMVGRAFRNGRVILVLLSRLSPVYKM